jgi:hypothetical protein
MYAAAIRETELVSRTVAKWGSVAAVLVFGVAFVTDKTFYWQYISNQYVHIVLTLVIFAGYALAWTKRSEVLGSVIALAAMVALFVYATVSTIAPPPIFFAVGLPALFHLVAVALHRFVVLRPEK